MCRPSRGISASNSRRWSVVSDASSLTRPVVVFDGACGFCTWCVHAAQRYVGSDVSYVPYQRADLPSLGITEAQAADSVQFIAPGYVRSGARAVAAILSMGHEPWPLVAGILDAPTLRPFAERGYRFVARHRGRLPGMPPALG